MADPENHIDRILGESKECLMAWKQLYKAAVLETNMDLVPRRVLAIVYAVVLHFWPSKTIRQPNRVTVNSGVNSFKWF